MAQMVKNVPVMQETQVWSLGPEDTLKEVMTIHSSILSEESHGQRSMADYSPWSHKELDTTEWLNTSSCPGSSVVETPAAMQETLVQSLSQEDPLEKR